ncbi:MAG: AMP-binding protein [Halioglobus sp.]
MSETLFERACARAHIGMEIAVVAAEVPDRVAIYSDHGNLTFAELNRQANQVAHLLRARGIKEGDALALLCGNRPEFAIVRYACHRMGLRLTPVNWHLAADEITYIVDNCDAVALIADIRVSEQAQAAIADNKKLRVRIAVGGGISGFEPFDATLQGISGEDIDNPSLGNMMLYTSGTTGRPKGVLRDHPDPQKAADMQAILSAVFQFQPDTGEDCALATGPLYHAGPFNLCMTTPLSAGISTVFMDKWEPEAMLRLIQQFRITHTFCVPTMFVRLLQLDESVRSNYDISTIRFVIHGAAPCAIATKQTMLDWFGPVIWEMFAGTEGQGTIVSPQEWLEKPGTVGRAAPDHVHILDDNGNIVPAGQSGMVYLRNPPDSKFSYYKDEAKTADVLRGEYFTAGDMGHLDEDGYLFLTGRSAEVIISGGVNIYPQEIDDVLASHNAVGDVACVGVPHEDWGEEVKAVVQLREGLTGNSELAAELITLCESRLAKQKLPRSVDFVNDLPRSHAGKVQRRALRERYWQGRERQI